MEEKVIQIIIDSYGRLTFLTSEGRVLRELFEYETETVRLSDRTPDLEKVEKYHPLRR